MCAEDERAVSLWIILPNVSARLYQFPFTITSSRQQAILRLVANRRFVLVILFT